jgi:hypothetical protein
MSTFKDLARIGDLITDENWKAVLVMVDERRVEQAIAAAIGLLSQSAYLLVPSEDPDMALRLAAIEFVVGRIGNAALMSQGPTASLILLYCLAVDMGFHDHAYNAANGVMESARNESDYRKAQAYFKIAIATVQDPSLKAAALVNYCPILRDGLVGGKPDLHAAIDIYEKAAKLGLVQAMFNVANVCMWQVNEGNCENIEKACFWINALVEKIERNEDFLDMDNPSLFPEILGQAFYWMARYNIDGLIEGASLCAGIRLLKKSMNATSVEIERKRWNLECAYSQKILQMGGSLSSTKGQRWHGILSAIDWAIEAPIRLHDCDTEVMKIIDSSINLHVIVISSVFMPDGLYRELFSLDQLLEEQGIVNYIVLSPYALFMEIGDKIAMPVMLMHCGARYLMGINLVESPDIQVISTTEGRDTMAACNLLKSQVMPMAFNAYLDACDIHSRDHNDRKYLALSQKWRLPFGDVTPVFTLLKH